VSGRPPKKATLSYVFRGHSPPSLDVNWFINPDFLSVGFLFFGRCYRCTSQVNVNSDDVIDIYVNLALPSLPAPLFISRPMASAPSRLPSSASTARVSFLFMNARRLRAASNSRRRLPSRSMRRWTLARNVSDRCRRARGHPLRCLQIPLKVNVFLQCVHTTLGGVEFLWSRRQRRS